MKKIDRCTYIFCTAKSLDSFYCEYLDSLFSVDHCYGFFSINQAKEVKVRWEVTHVLHLDFSSPLPGISLQILCYTFLKLAVLLCKWFMLLDLTIYTHPRGTVGSASKHRPSGDEGW